MDNLSFERSPIIKYREQKMENQSLALLMENQRPYIGDQRPKRGPGRRPGRRPERVPERKPERGPERRPERRP